MQPVYASKFLSKIKPEDRERFLLSGIVPINDIYFPYFDSTFRHEVYYGGRGSGKSKFIAQKLIKKCAKDKYFRWQYSRKHQVDIKESQYELLKSSISEHGLWNDFTFNASTLRITHRTGNCLIAKGMDDPEKSKGLHELNGFWGEEVTEFDQADIVTVNQNLRTLKAPIQSIVGFNPIHEDHWVRHYYFSKENPHKIKPELGNAVAIRSTLYNNLFINQEQYAAELIAGASGNHNIIRVVLEGDWGQTENANPWLHAFRDIGQDNSHIHTVPFLASYPIYLFFDINADPVTCTAWQMTERKGGVGSFLHGICEFGGHIKIEDMCSRIRTRFPTSILYVGGDRSGQNEDVGRNQTIYQIIQSLLGLSDKQMLLETHNIEHADSRQLCNALFYHYPVVLDPSMEKLIKDCRKAMCDPKAIKGSQLFKDREKGYEMDYFDSMRYMAQRLFLKYIKENYLAVLFKK